MRNFVLICLLINVAVGATMLRYGRLKRGSK